MRCASVPSSVGAIFGVALSGLLVALSAAGVGDWPALAWLAFAPWLASISRLAWRAAALSGCAMGLAYIIPGRWSTFAEAVGGAGFSGWQGVVATLAFFACYSVPFAAYGLIDGRLRSLADRHGLQIAALLRASVLAGLICACWSPFPYTPATALLPYIGVAQWASVGGEPLLLALMLWPSALLAGLWQARALAREWLGTAAGTMLALVLANLAGHGHIAAMDRLEAQGAGLRLSALTLQLHLPARASATWLLRDRPGGAESAIELTRRGYAAAPQCEVAIWPETPLGPRDGLRSCAAGQALASATGKPLLMQCHRAEGSQYRVTAEWLAADARASAVHAKSSLVPGYETPLLGQGPLLAGQPGSVFAVDAQRRVIPAVCYELYSADHLRRAVLAGGQFVAFMASFNGFGGLPIERWHAPMARLRAIAYGVPIAQAGNRAGSGWIDANGRVRKAIEAGHPQAHCLDLWSPATPPTTYARIAPVAAVLPALLPLALIGLARSARRRRVAHQAPRLPSVEAQRSAP